MCTRAVTWALRQDLEDHLAARLLAVLGDYADKAGMAWPAISTLAKRVHACASTVRRKLQELARRGLIRILEGRDANGRQSSNRYVLNLGGRVSELWEGEGVRAVTGGRVSELCHPNQEDRTKKGGRESPKDARATPRVSISGDWKPDPAAVAFAENQGLAPHEIEHEAARFRDRALARGETFADLFAAWRAWLTSPFAPRNRQPSNRPTALDGVRAITAARLAAEARQEPSYGPVLAIGR